MIMSLILSGDIGFRLISSPPHKQISVRHVGAGFVDWRALDGVYARLQIRCITLSSRPPYLDTYVSEELEFDEVLIFRSNSKRPFGG